MTYEHHRETDPSGLTLIVEADDHPLNPREEYEHLGQMVCWHRRYSLGDRHEWSEPDEFRQHLKSCKGAVALPVYLFDHSGLAVSTTPFHCPWDSGQIGMIWMSRKAALDAFGPGGKRLTPKLRLQAEEALRAEVREYHQFLSGDVWHVRVENEDGEILDSCGGYYGSDYAVEEGRAMLATLAPEERQRKAAALAELIESERPDLTPVWLGEEAP